MEGGSTSSSSYHQQSKEVERRETEYSCITMLSCDAPRTTVRISLNKITVRGRRNLSSFLHAGSSKPRWRLPHAVSPVPDFRSVDATMRLFLARQKATNINADDVAYFWVRKMLTVRKMSHCDNLVLHLSKYEHCEPPGWSAQNINTLRYFSPASL
jgi:hypothetical protein